MGWSVETRKRKVVSTLDKQGIKCLIQKVTATESTVMIECDKKPTEATMSSVESLFPDFVYIDWGFEWKLPPENEPIRGEDGQPEGPADTASE